ncbi:hemerythrin domain-containing protein [Lysobacter psychrotolerans]|uniref:Hemerythrin domain-containing protein n=1 Tax=Montanilutibacter psychrotolerans TaxID=1327343 RepID=A0A3M8SUJ8_9GAMM|nr:hemerythrin domain-containing protein [Lysobacter psychrotolerans]
MLGVFRRLLGQTPAPKPQSSPRATVTLPARPARDIAYDPELVDSLQRDHAELVNLFGSIGRQAEIGAFEQIPAALVSFKTLLEGHLIAENVRFYNYVENSLRGDSLNSELIRSFRREMNTIARGVVDFVKKYQLATFDVATRDAFLGDYRAVGALLTQRIEREENSLYPLYQPMRESAFS